MINHHRPTTVLTIAGSDSGGGAGIQADIKSISANGCFALSVITAITAQNSYAVTDIHQIPQKTIINQLVAVLEDFPIDAIKIGMLGDKETIHCVADTLIRQEKRPPIVLDPVMISKAGAALLQPDAINALKNHLLPLATLITPNLPEAQILAGLENEDNAQILAKALINKEIEQHILIKGGHRTGNEINDYLQLTDGQVFSFSHPKITSQNTHGTGCSLSSAIAAQLALGKDIKQAIQLATDYIFTAIEGSKGWQLGKGHGPIAHFHYQ